MGILAKRAGLLVFSLAAAVLTLTAGPTEPSCTYFTVVTQDELGNLRQGLSAENVKWFQKTFAKKYPGVCYAEPGPTVPVVFYITITPDVYHGTRIVNDTSTQTNPVHATVTDRRGNTAEIDGTVNTTTTNSTAVPYSVDYGIYTLSVQRRRMNGQFDVAHRFQQKGLYMALWGVIPLGGRGHHPLHALISDAVKWVDQVGLADQGQGVLGYDGAKLSGSDSSVPPEQSKVVAAENTICNKVEPSPLTAARGEIVAPAIAPGPPSSAVSSVKPAEPSPATTTNVITARFKSTPANAEVNIDGVYWGTTPTADLTRLQAGAHTIIVKKSGYKIWEGKVDLALGDDLTVNAVLEEVETTKSRISGLN